ncbi:hypothetical protein HAX54_034274, partial [Datura stramonium]|nr:hypothetical protein [Datura stramonium]
MEKKSNIFELIQDVVTIGVWKYPAELIQAVVTGGMWKYPAEFKRRKHEIIEYLMNPEKTEERKQMEKFQVEHQKENKTNVIAEKQSGKDDADVEIKNMKNCNGGGLRRKIKVSIKKHKRPEEFEDV